MKKFFRNSRPTDLGVRLDVIFEVQCGTQILARCLLEHRKIKAMGNK